MKKNQITQSVIIGFATLIAAISWSGLKLVLLGGDNWIWPSIGFLILLVFLSLNWVLTKSKAVLLITLFFILVSFLFSFGFTFKYSVALLITLLLFAFGSFRAINEKELRVKLQIDRILKQGLPAVLTGLSLIIATAYYFSPLIIENQNQIRIPRPLFDVIVKPIIGTIEEQFPSAKISKQVSLLESDKDFKEALYQAVNQEINKFGQSYQEYFPLSLATGVFLALRTMAIPFMWLIILLSWLIFRALVSFKAIKIQEKAVLKQVIEI